jgi:hypothetical protein
VTALQDPGAQPDALSAAYDTAMADPAFARVLLEAPDRGAALSGLHALAGELAAGVREGSRPVEGVRP